MEIYKKRMEEENRRAEELEKLKQEREEERKRVLEGWHKNKCKHSSEYKSSTLFRKKHKMSKNLETLMNDS